MLGQISDTNAVLVSSPIGTYGDAFLYARENQSSAFACDKQHKTRQTDFHDDWYSRVLQDTVKNLYFYVGGTILRPF